MNGLLNTRIEPITVDNVAEACKLEVRPEQQGQVAPVAVSLAEAYVNPASAWPRVVYAGDRLVAFVMGGFDLDSPIECFRSGIWRLNVAAGEQGRQYGRFAVEAVIAEARSRGNKRLSVLWAPGEHSPEGFYLKLGFRPSGETFAGQKVGWLELD
ncbi:MAG TPA: GNAT family N-acetyltransferase [Candidatus Stackebrandtia excrementipullorum]|nr:GNAT family N-acetyltransferase [Candidatus Stackebrandtia excrementipullorum]